MDQPINPFQNYDNPFPSNWNTSPEAVDLFQKLQELDKKIPQKGPLIRTQYGTRNYLMPGQVVRFNYAFFKPGHDSQPLVLVAKDEHLGGYLDGINLHYLTVPKARVLLEQSCNNPSFSYRSIMGDGYISGAYRTYRWTGVQYLRYEDCEFLIGLMSLHGLLSVNQLTAMIMQIRQMGSQQVVPPAAPSSEQPFQSPGSQPQ